jgi:CheY-like chemotaxis protein
MLRPSLVDLGELLASLILLAQHTAGPNVQLCPIVARDLEPVSVDSAQLQTALLNLIINARDSISGSGAITLHAYVADDDMVAPAGCESKTGFVVVAVSDTGRGMDQKTAERACEPFFSTKGHGSGLGLSMVQGFARQSGGDIRISSVLNRGTSVEIWLPRLVGGPVTAGQPPRRHHPQTGHILLVDDSPDVLLVLAAFLTGAGFTVTQAANAREALWHLSRGTAFALMISDFIMPGMDGLDLAMQARQSRPALPVLLISGFAQTDRLNDLPTGFVLLRKPFRKEDLLEAVFGLLPRAPGLTPPVGDYSTTAGPPGAGAVVEPSSWDAPPHSTAPQPKPTSA